MFALIRLAILLLSVAGLAAAQTTACTWRVDPRNASFGAVGGTLQVDVTLLSGKNCAEWTSVSSVNWIVVTYGQRGTQTGTVGLTVQPNYTGTQRVGNVQIAGFAVTISQTSGACQYQLTPSNASVPREGGSGTIDVHTECAWTAVSNVPWLSATGSATGNGFVSWIAESNITSTSRSGTISIGTSNFTVTQGAPCSTTVSPTSANYGGNGGSGSITVSVSGANCGDRTVTTTVDWITLTNLNLTGPVTYTVAQNLTGQMRVGQIFINDQAVYIQQTSSCTFAVTPQSVTVPATGASGTLAVAATCSWEAKPSDVWITVISGRTGTTNGTVAYAVAQNFLATDRSGSISVGNAALQILQPGVGCNVTLGAENISVGRAATEYPIQVSAPDDCTWRAVSNAEWITIQDGAPNTAAGQVLLRIAANAGGQRRIGTVVIGGRILTVTQAAADCSVELGLRSVQVEASGATGTVPVTSNCAWEPRVDVGWITATRLETALRYTVQANPTADSRTGTITVSGQSFTIQQAGQRCSVTLGSNSAALPARGGAGSIIVTGGAGCSWTARTAADWLKVEWSSVSGSGSVRFSAAANVTGVDRAATVSVGSESIPVQQSALRLQISRDGLVNAASYAAGAIAPGEILTLYGSGFGPASLMQDSRFPRTLGDTRVVFDGVAAPIVYAAENQLSVIVPYAVAGKQSVDVQVEYYGVLSNGLLLPVAGAAPGIFSLAANGTGQGAILNQDYSVNGGATPAARGSVIMIFATGEGQTRPVGVDGRIAATPLPVPVLPVKVFIGGVEAQVTYAGGAPGLVAGVMQVNARVPDSIVPAPDVPVVLRVGEFESQPGITVGVR